MPNPNYTRVGTFFIAMIILSFVGYFFISGKFKFNNSIKLYVFCEDALSLQNKSPVLFRGLKVGEINELYLEQGKILVELSIDNEMKLPKSTKFYTGLDNFFGDQKIDLVIEEPRNDFYQNGDTVTTNLVFKPMNDSADSNFFKIIEPSIKELSSIVGQALIDYAESLDSTDIEIKEK